VPLSLRIPSEKEKLIQKAATKTGKTKTAYILQAVDEKLGVVKDRGQLVRELAGWLSHEDAEELRESVQVFETVLEGDWD
jgi:predicted DNA-binding protein